MKKIPFDLEKAKAGAKIVTRDGKPAEILKYDFNREGEQLLVVCRKDIGGDDYVYNVHKNGIWVRGDEHGCDLFLEVEPTFRPYTNAEEVLRDMKEHGPMVRNTVSWEYYAIKQISNQDVIICAYKFAFPFVKFQTMFTWQDGHPFGVEEGGDNE